MSRLVMGAFGIATMVLLGASFASAQERTFTGVVTDEKLNCIQSPMTVPSMVVEYSSPAPAGGGPVVQKQPTWTKDTCVLYWAHYASPKEKIVLYDPETKKTYFVEDENSISAYAGYSQKVTVAGTYDEATKAIRVSRVQLK